MIQQGQQHAITLFHNYAQRLADKLKTQTKTFFLPLIVGALFAIAQRRTVTKWILAAQMSDNYRQIYYHMTNIGCKSPCLFDEQLKGILEQLGDVLETASAIRFVLDDSPTKRYGMQVEGAGWHYNPTPGKTDATLCFGHCWVVAALVVTHPVFGEVSFPIGAELYLRQKEIDKLQGKYQRAFRTKTAMAVAMVNRLVPKFKGFEKKIEVIVDGAYAKDTVLLPLGELANVVTITRLRRDAVLFELPPNVVKQGRGRPKKYGERIDLKVLVESQDDWQWVECRQYGRVVTKQVKSFVAASKLTRDKPIRVVIVKEDEKVWVPLMSTDADASVVGILESYAVRFGIEEMFKDLKEIWGWGKQELRKLESNEAATAMNMLLFGMTELATWDRSHDELVDRSACPWDDAERRPSHADRRNYLRRAMIAKDFNDAWGWTTIPAKITQVLEKLVRLNA